MRALRGRRLAVIGLAGTCWIHTGYTNKTLIRKKHVTY
jgi:hypothetical protein